MTIYFLLRNWTTEKFEFVPRFPKDILHIHNSFVSSIALAFLYSSTRRVNNFGNH